MFLKSSVMNTCMMYSLMFSVAILLELNVSKALVLGMKRRDLNDFSLSNKVRLCHWAVLVLGD